MIESLKSRLSKKDPSYAILDVHGVSLKVHISLTTYEKLPAVGDQTRLLTYLHVREDILALYGFSDEEERSLFGMLIGISGIGPRLAMTILSGANPPEFKRRIISGDVKALTIIPGIGGKTAKRIIVELMEKFIEPSDKDTFDLLSLTPEKSGLVQDVVKAMVSLGFSKSQAHSALKQLEKSGELEGNLEDILKKALTKI